MKKINIVLVLLTLVGCASPALPTGDNQITIAQMQATQTTNTGELTPTILPTDAKTPKSSSTAPTATPTDIPPFIEDFERDLGGQLDLTRWVIVPVNNAEYTINQSEGYLRLFVSGDPIVDWGGVSLVLKPFQGVPLNHIGVFEAKLLISSDRVSDSASTQIKIVVDDQMDGTYQAVWCGVNAWNDSQPRIECGVEDTKNDVYSVEGYHSASIVYDEWHTLRIEIDYQTPEFFFFFDDEFWGSHIPTASVWSEPETRVNLDIWVGRNTGASATSYVDDVFIRSTPEFTYTTTGLGPIGPKGTTEATTPTVIRVPRDYPTIQRAIFATRDGDTVLVAAGTYYENLNYLGKDITVTSEAGPDATIIDGSQRGSVVTFERGESGAAVLEGFTIMNGLASFEFAFGGGISIRDASPTITNNVITRNGAFVGGGIYIQGNGASPIIKENVISNNIAPERGGGVAIWDGSTPVLQENVIADNLAMEGAGIEIANHSSPIIDGNTIENNWAGADLDWSLHAEQHLNGIDIKVGAEEGPNFGAGILVVNHSSPTIENNEITGNYGGGIAVIWNSSPTIKNNTISNNRGEVLGGGIFIALGSSPQISENQISGNRALWGGGIQVFRDSSPRIQNNTIKNNRAEIEGGGIYVWEHSNPIVVENTIEGNQAPIGGAIWLDRTSSILSAKEDSLDLGDLESAIISEAGNLLSGSVFRQPPSPSSGSFDLQHSISG